MTRREVPDQALLVVGAAGSFADGLSLGGFRGDPTFPALFLGAAAGLMAAELPGFGTTPAIAAGMAAATVVVLGLPLSRGGARAPAHRRPAPGALR